MRTALVYVSDKNYHDITEASIASMVIHVQAPVEVHFFQIGYFRPVSEKFEKAVHNRGCTIQVHKGLSSPPSDFELDRQRKWSHITRTTLLKAWAIDEIVDSYDKVIYSDGDVLAASPMDVMVQFSDDGRTLRAEYDYAAYMSFDDDKMVSFSENLPGAPNYFNAGFFLVDSARWVEREALKQFEVHLKMHEEHCPYFDRLESTSRTTCRVSDQCIFNMVFHDDWQVFDGGWNVQQVARNVENRWKSSIVQHYTGHRKFYPALNRLRNSREVALLRRIQQEFGREYLGDKMFDWGLSAALNAMRFRGLQRDCARALQELDSRRPSDSTAGEK